MLFVCICVCVFVYTLEPADCFMKRGIHIVFQWQKYKLVKQELHNKTYC